LRTPSLVIITTTKHLAKSSSFASCLHESRYRFEDKRCELTTLGSGVEDVGKSDGIEEFPRDVWGEIGIYEKGRSKLLFGL
jgi:hypothetical protein